LRLRPFTIADVSEIGPCASATPPQYAQRDEIPVGSPREWQMTATSEDEIFMNSVDDLVPVDCEVLARR
jgi:hypothetical protein